VNQIKDISLPETLGLSLMHRYIEKNIEYTLYKKYKPECNEQEPEEQEIEINFPV
jgi:hypothetical protein